MEHHLGADVVHIELANQVSFLNRAALDRTLREVPQGGHILLDATGSDYIDPDILSLIRDFKENTGPAKGVSVSLKGFRTKYQLQDDIQFVDYSTRELQEQMTPAQALDVLKAGNARFRTGKRLSRDFGRQVDASARGQHPLAVVLSCIDSRTPAELILDLGLGDIFSVRIAGNVISPKVLGSIEYGCAVAGAKLVVVLGHTRCGAVTSAVSQVASPAPACAPSDLDCRHVQSILDDIVESIDPKECQPLVCLPLGRAAVDRLSRVSHSEHERIDVRSDANEGFERNTIDHGHLRVDDHRVLEERCRCALRIGLDVNDACNTCCDDVLRA
jgi:carbonic anhydrase/SulP family sulfate permease